MKTIRALGIGVGIWGLGVAAFISSFFIPVMENPEEQANRVLFFAVMPLVWLGSQLYYKSGAKTKGVWVGLTFLGVAVLLDALITVPFLVIPNGGSHLEFFTDPGFWIIALLFLSIPIAYWYIKVRPTTEFI